MQTVEIRKIYDFSLLENQKKSDSEVPQGFFEGLL